MKYCQLVGCGHGSKGPVEVNNMPAIKTRQEILKPVQMPPVRPERSSWLAALDVGTALLECWEDCDVCHCVRHKETSVIC